MRTDKRIYLTRMIRLSVFYFGLLVRQCHIEITNMFKIRMAAEGYIHLGCHLQMLNSKCGMRRTSINAAFWYLRRLSYVTRVTAWECSFHGVFRWHRNFYVTFDIRILYDIFFIAWKLRRSVMFIVKRQTNRFKLRRSDMYLTFMEWKFKNTTTCFWLDWIWEQSRIKIITCHSYGVLIAWLTFNYKHFTPYGVR